MFLRQLMQNVDKKGKGCGLVFDQTKPVHTTSPPPLAEPVHSFTMFTPYGAFHPLLPLCGQIGLTIMMHTSLLYHCISLVVHYVGHFSGTR